MDLQTLRAKLDEARYICGEDVATTLLVALKLGRPLLIEGAAGVGKTEVAKVMAAALDRERFRAVVDEAKDCFDFVLMDSPAGLGDGFQLARAAADRAIVVSAVDPAALRDAQRAVAELHDLPQLHLVMNRVQPKLIRKLRTSIDSAMDTAGLPLLGVVPEDAAVTMAAASGVPLVLATYKGAAPAYLNISKRLMGQRVPLLRIR